LCHFGDDTLTAAACIMQYIYGYNELDAVPEIRPARVLNRGGFYRGPRGIRGLHLRGEGFFFYDGPPAIGLPDAHGVNQGAPPCK
jgi:hypothetical protein